MQSKFKLFSKGIVAASKELNSKMILVTLVEHQPCIDGSINSDIDQLVDKGVDASGKPYQIKVTLSDTVKAEWLNNSNSNRVTPPDVVAGEEVLIYRYDTNDKYYWETIGNGHKRLETVINRYSNNTDPSITELDDDNSYWSKVSTHEKVIVIQTSKSNGEEYTFVAFIDTDQGAVGINDDIGNRIYLNSGDRIVEMENADGSIVSCNKTAINILSSDEINMQTKTMNVTADTINTKAKLHEEKIDSINTTGSTMNVYMSDITFTATFTMNGISTLNGATSITGSTTLGAGATISGGQLTHNGISVGSTHKHAGGTIDGKTEVVIPT